MRPRDRDRESQRSGERELNPEPRGPDPLWTVARTGIRPSSGVISCGSGVVLADRGGPEWPEVRFRWLSFVKLGRPIKPVQPVTERENL